MKRALLLSLIMAFFVVATVRSSELEARLREANRLYYAGRYAEAKSYALEFHEFYPDDLNAISLLGMTTFASRNYDEAKKWFRILLQRKPTHAIALRYAALIQEIEHRKGSVSFDPGERAENDSYETAREFKRGWFGPNFPVFSDEPAQVPLAHTALPMPHPTEPEMLTNNTVASIARRAMNEENFIKAYLFYSQLLEADRDNRSFLLGKTEAAFHMKRYLEVVQIMGPYLASESPTGFTPEELIKADELLTTAKDKMNN